MEPELDSLRRLPFVLDLSWHPEIDATKHGFDAWLSIRTPERSFRLAVELRGGVLSRAAAAGVADRPTPKQADGKLLVADTITSGVAASLREAGLNYLDGAGNCSLSLGDRYFAHIEGKVAPKQPRPAGLRAASYRVLGAALIEPGLFNLSLRAIAARCGVSTTAVLDVRANLTEQRLLVRSSSGITVVRRLDLLDRFLIGYRDILRPHLHVGRFALPHDSVEALGRTLAHALPRGSWAWGGSQATLRAFSVGTTGDVVVHLLQLDTKKLPKLPLRPDPEGAVEVLAIPCAPASDEHPQPALAESGLARDAAPPRGCVHPLLALAELERRPDDRSREVAATVRERLVAGWGAEDGV